MKKTDIRASFSFGVRFEMFQSPADNTVDLSRAIPGRSAKGKRERERDRENRARLTRFKLVTVKAFKRDIRFSDA